ncbi:MAG: hypothetical protein C5B46_02175 [Proteobacteria bacterium]|nr:MAG: hypothetical protein C5B46_02175 [Pseudomonadota bacterium]
MSSADTATGADREFFERVYGLYHQAASNGWGAMLAAFCMVAVMWPFVGRAALIAWLASYALVVSLRIPLVRAFTSDPVRESHARVWARRYTLIVLLSGTWWGLASIVLLPDGRPLALACFVAVMAASVAGGISSQSFHLPAVVGYVSLALLPLVFRLLLSGEPSYVPVAATLGLFYLFLVWNARRQYRRLGEIIHLEQHNLALIDGLKVQKSEAEAMRAQAERANLAKSQFLAAASHDLRQPMHALGLLSASLQEMTKEPEKRVVVEKIFASIEALESLFSELLDLSRLDAGQIQIRLADVPLDRVFERLGENYAALAASKHLTLTLESSAAVIYTDPLLLERLLGNLLANAIRYTEAGEVEVRATVQDRDVSIQVRDTGVGIPKKLQERVFDEFFQVGNPERDRNKGLGLGLAIVKRISRLLGYPLTLESEPGAGTCLRLTVPAGNPAAIAAPEETRESFGNVLSGKTVLLIDDAVNVMDGMQELLSRWGCEVLRSRDAAEARFVAHQRTPDVIIADARLEHGASGLDAIDSVQRALDRTIPAVVITGDTAIEVLKEAGARGLPLLHKPVRPVKLRSALTHLLISRER